MFDQLAGRKVQREAKELALFFIMSLSPRAGSEHLHGILKETTIN